MIALNDQASGIKAPHGHVVIEVPYLQKPNIEGMELSLNADESVGDYTVRSGVVVSTSTPIFQDGNFMFEGPLQVNVGDKVWAHPNAFKQLAVDAEVNKAKVVTINERIFVVVPYQMLVMKLSAGEFYGLNDYVVTEMLNEKEDYGYFDLSFTGGSGILQKVVAPALRGTTYKTIGTFSDIPVEVEKGDVIIVRNNRRMALEHSMDIQLPSRWYAQQSRYIMAKRQWV